MKFFPFKGEAARNVKALSLAAMFNDVGEDMYAPFLPAFATRYLNINPVQYGLLEGICEAVHRVLQILTGYLTDRVGRKAPIFAGYFLVAISRALLVFVTIWYMLIPVRALRQIGRAIRGPARDSCMAESVPQDQRGIAFGILNTVDTFGAVIGPLIGIVILSYLTHGVIQVFPFTKEIFSWQAYLWLFLGASAFTFISSSIIAIFLKETLARTQKSASPFQGISSYFKRKKLFLFTVSGMLLAIGVSPFSMFLLFATRELKASEPILAALYVTCSLVNFLTAYPAGIIVDKINRVYVHIAGILLCGISLCIIPFVDLWWLLIIPVSLRGIFDSIWAVSYKAILSALAPAEIRGQAFGIFSSLYGLTSFLSPILLGSLWTIYGPASGFLTLSCICLLSAILLLPLVIHFTPQQVSQL